MFEFLFFYRIRSNKIISDEKCRFHKFHIFYLLINHLPEHQSQQK